MKKKYILNLFQYYLVIYYLLNMKKMVNLILILFMKKTYLKCLSNQKKLLFI